MKSYAVGAGALSVVMMMEIVNIENENYKPSAYGRILVKYVRDAWAKAGELYGIISSIFARLDFQRIMKAFTNIFGVGFDLFFSFLYFFKGFGEYVYTYFPESSPIVYITAFALVVASKP